MDGEIEVLFIPHSSKPPNVTTIAKKTMTKIFTLIIVLDLYRQYLGK
jgi:hypothetical protein